MKTYTFKSIADGVLLEMGFDQSLQNYVEFEHHRHA